MRTLKNSLTARTIATLTAVTLVGVAGTATAENDEKRSEYT